MKIYKCVEQGIILPDGSTKSTYGITYGKVEVKDVSENKELVESLVTLFNKEELDPIHLPFILEEML